MVTIDNATRRVIESKQLYEDAMSDAQFDYAPKGHFEVMSVKTGQPVKMADAKDPTKKGFMGYKHSTTPADAASGIARYQDAFERINNFVTQVTPMDKKDYRLRFVESMDLSEWDAGNQLYEGIFNKAEAPQDNSHIIKGLKANPNAIAVGQNGQLKLIENKLEERDISVAHVYEVGTIRDGQRQPGKQITGNDLDLYLQKVAAANGSLYIRFIESLQEGGPRKNLDYDRIAHNMWLIHRNDPAACTAAVEKLNACIQKKIGDESTKRNQAGSQPTITKGDGEVLVESGMFDISDCELTEDQCDEFANRFAALIKAKDSSEVRLIDEIVWDAQNAQEALDGLGENYELDTKQANAAMAIMLQILDYPGKVLSESVMDKSDDDKLDDIDGMYAMFPEQMEELMLEYGSDPDSDTWTDGIQDIEGLYRAARRLVIMRSPSLDLAWKSWGGVENLRSLGFEWTKDGSKLRSIRGESR
jgi:hypothetical protein